MMIEGRPERMPSPWIDVYASDIFRSFIGLPQMLRLISESPTL